LNHWRKPPEKEIAGKLFFDILLKKALKQFVSLKIFILLHSFFQNTFIQKDYKNVRNS